MMKKAALILLICALLAVSASAYAVYDDWKIILGDASFALGWNCYPLDAHNAVVVASTDQKDRPWHVSWYRDGELFRDLAGYTADSFLEDFVMPKPVIWDGEHLTMLFSERQGAYRTVRNSDGTVSADPENYKNYLAVWTDNGLEEKSERPANWYGTSVLGKAEIRYEAGAFRIFVDGNEAELPKDIRKLKKNLITGLRCFPVSEDSLILAYVDRADLINHVVSVDHGEKKYDVSLSLWETTWTVEPDGNGGFFNQAEMTWEEAYSPVRLKHYNADGKQDRVMELKGNELVIRLDGSVCDRSTGSTVLYGAAVAESRQVYTAFAMTVDKDLKVTSLDVRKIDPAYRAYQARVSIAQDGSAWVFVYQPEYKGRLRPALIPFRMLEKSEESYGLTLE